MTYLTTLDDLVTALPAERQQRVKNKAQVLSQSIELAKLRKTKKLRQTELAALMGVTQANVSKVESGKDIQLSTLQNYVSALGGEISITVQISDRIVTLI